jgi:uncharacterized cupredoxin-like copper-binding protein
MGSCEVYSSELASEPTSAGTADSINEAAIQELHTVYPPLSWSNADLKRSMAKTGSVFMDNVISRICTGLPLAAVALISLVFPPSGYVNVLAHEKHEHFSAGDRGNPQKPSRTVQVSMLEEGKRMLFDPPSIEVRLGEQIRFVLFNEGSEYHEFVLATHAENRKHAEFMKKFPKMEHNDPNAKRLSALSSGELLWKFTKRGEFEYACLIPGHFEAGMHGKITVK